MALQTACSGTVLIVLGSLVAVAAPGDGQTAMVTYPLWLCGGVLGIMAIASAIVGRARRRGWVVIGLFALIAISSVVWALVVSINYVSPNVSEQQNESQNEPQQ